MEYSFARSDHKVEKDDFDQEFHDCLIGGGTMGVITKQFPWLVPLMQSLPDFMTTWAKMSSYVQVTRVSFITYLKEKFTFYSFRGEC